MTEPTAGSATVTSPPLRVLLVEDNEFDVAVFARAFRKAEVPCDIVRCRNGEEVLAGLRDAELAVDLLVSDHLLPGISGFDLCVELLERQCPFALVLLTGGGTEQMAIRALRAGIDDYIVKDTAQEYLQLLPLVLPKVARRRRERRARQLADQRGAVQDPVAPVPPSQEDSSLGLNVYAALVQQRGGRLWVEQEEGSLPNLHFTVPLAPAEAEAWQAQQKESEASPAEPDAQPAAHPSEAQDEGWLATAGRTSHVLIAHANPIVVFVATRLLERRGYRTVCIPRGDKVVEALDREPFDLVLMGLELSSLDGLAATRAIRGQDGTAADIPIVALGIDPEESLDACRKAGMSDHIPRPLGRESLRAALARLG